ncbi:hypothetical protein SAMN05443572_1011243 [Myxococcus fulvus]|uniref:Lipoprotein n=1 Tax=Myxococcus fulvus TaxID=33 RepID=A0ABY1BYJ0_MYXFU|nr:hypothetical protein SAMN05443572_1011243 [Myxococcus fulvus]
MQAAAPSFSAGTRRSVSFRYQVTTKVQEAPPF